MEKNPLNKHNFYKPFRKTLIAQFGDEGAQIWEDTEEEPNRILSSETASYRRGL